MFIISANLLYGNNIEACLIGLVAIAICYNKSINRLQYLNALQSEHYITHSIGLEVFDIENNYEIYYQEILALNDDGRINEIPSEIVQEIIYVYKKNKKEKISNEEMINRSIELDNENYIEITNE